MCTSHNLSTEMDIWEVSCLGLLEIRLLSTNTSPARGLLTKGCMHSQQWHRHTAPTMLMVTSLATSQMAGLLDTPPHSAGLGQSSSWGLHVSPCRWFHIEFPQWPHTSDN